MTVEHIPLESQKPAIYTGLAADTRPTLIDLDNAGALYWATDTGDIDRWDGSNWRRLVSANQAMVAPPFIEIQRDNVGGQSLVHKFGRNDNVPSGSWAFVSLLGQTAHVLSAATTVRIKAGGNAADTAAGAGAREITVQGIVATTLLEETETIVTAGAAASSATTKSFWRVHRKWVSAVGTYGAANTAAIVLENGAGGTDIITLGAGEGQTQDAVFSIPAGKTGYLLSIHATVDSGKKADIRMFTRNDLDDTVAPMPSKRLKLYFDGIAGEFHYDPKGPELSLAEKTDIWFEAQGVGATAEVSVDFELLLVDD